MQATIIAALTEYQDRYLATNLVDARVLKNILVQANNAQIDLTYGYPIAGRRAELCQELQQLLISALPQSTFDIQINQKIEAHRAQGNLSSLPQIKNIIAVASGKGGVGKSTVALQLALALNKIGASVGLLDADIYGPSQPQLLGTLNTRATVANKIIQPIIQHDLQTISIGNLVAPDAALAWRGPMLGKALQQLLRDTAWNDLDYLIIDLPPGTGDVQLTLCQTIPVTGAVIVTTPQDLALSDVRRAIEMFKKLNIHMLGVIENMSQHTCTHCGHQETIFGQDGGERLAADYQIPLLGQLPLDGRVRALLDAGDAQKLFTNNDPFAQLFVAMAYEISAKISLQSKDYAAKFPKIVVE